MNGTSELKERVGVYPGTFDPPTVAHVAIAEAARTQGGLDRLDLVVSELPLGKEESAIAPLRTRVEFLSAVAETRPWLTVIVTEGGLISDIAAGYDAVVMGADKWRQVVDPSWYGESVEARDEAVRRLPRLLLAPRGGLVPDGLPGDAIVLELAAEHGSVSSTGARGGRTDWIADEVGRLWKPRSR